jgi:hypothetical protein
VSYCSLHIEEGTFIGARNISNVITILKCTL